MFRRLAPIILPVIVLVASLFAGWGWLRMYTMHGESLRVPELEGLSLEEANSIVDGLGLRLMVVDSVYSDELPKGSVADQDPAAGIDVKPGRKIYLILNASQPKMIDMPRLVDLSKRQAISVLEIIGLKVRELQYKPDPCVDCVIEQQYRGQPIPKDARIRRGEAITLVLGSGYNGELVLVPDLLGLTNAEVQQVLNMASLNLGVVVECIGCNTPADSTLARVHRQSPPAREGQRMTMGSVIDIWLTADTTGLRPSQGWDDPARYVQKDTLDEAL